MSTLQDLAQYVTVDDPEEKVRAIVVLEAAQRSFREATAARREAMRSAVQAGVPLRDVARAAECSHESVRRIAVSQGAATLLLGTERYDLTEEQVDVLVYKLAGSAKGAFPKDIELLGAGTQWLTSAGELAHEMQAAKLGGNADPIVLNQDRAFALFQILRLTYTGRPTVLSRLYDVLRERYESSAPHVLAALAKTKPRKRRKR